MVFEESLLADMIWLILSIPCLRIGISHFLWVNKPRYVCGEEHPLLHPVYHFGLGTARLKELNLVPLLRTEQVAEVSA